MTYLRAIAEFLALAYSVFIDFIRFSEREAGREEAENANLAAQARDATIVKQLEAQADADHATDKLDLDFQRD